MIAKTLQNWTVEERIGEGGSGEVYLARHVEFDQLAAVKILHAKTGLEEQRILAELRHPNIARLYGFGEIEGRPYLVMEFVRGKRIDEYANERGLDMRARVALFAKVCEAVDYAHRNLVIHLDIKPANILVTDSGEPKLLDFGIARRAAGALTAMEQDAFSRPYASPEQVTPGSPISTRSDVYSLGALLYELIAGRPPLAMDAVGEAEIRRLIREVTPERPSEAVLKPRVVRSPKGQLIPLPPERIAAVRRSTVRELRRTLRGDLDNIALTALRKEEGRRYPSVQEFRRDINRYLENRPVHARPDSAAYSAIRAARRYPLWVVAIVLALTTLWTNVLLPWSLREQAKSSAARAAVLEKEIRITRDALGSVQAPSVQAEIEQLQAAIE